MHLWRKMHKDLYNACLYHRKTEYQKFNRSVGYFDHQNCLPDFKECFPEYKELGSHALQATVKRVDFAFQRFFKGLGGYPKFKSSRYYRGWTYPCKSGWKAHSNGKNGYLSITNLGKIKMRGKARTWGTPTTCTIVWKGGCWYASITVTCVPEREVGTEAVGVDFGTLTAAAFSNGEKIDNPRFLAQAQKEIKKLSKQLKRKRKPQRRKIKASRRWKKIQKRLAKLKRKVANRRQNWVHQTATQIVSTNSLVVTEKLELKKMTRKAKKRCDPAPFYGARERAPRQGSKRKRQKAGLNRSILDVGIGMLREAIAYKLTEAGGVFLEAPTKKIKPSQTCPACGFQKKKDLSERVHQCECGCVLDRDVAASQVMLQWALGTSVLSRREESSTSIPTVKYCGGFKQLSSKKRQKPPAQLD